MTKAFNDIVNIHDCKNKEHTTSQQERHFLFINLHLGEIFNTLRRCRRSPRADQRHLSVGARTDAIRYLVRRTVLVRGH